MLKKGLLIFFLIFATIGETKEYVIRYQTLSSGTLFHVETKEGEKIGKVVREKKSGGLLYAFLDAKDQLLANGPVEHHLTDTSVFLKDQRGGQIGWFSAEIHNLYPTEYKVFTKENRLIARGFMNWLGNSFVLFDPDTPKRYIATYFRPMFKLFNDNWHIDIHEENAIDLRLLSVIGAFQTACDLNFELLETKPVSY